MNISFSISDSEADIIANQYSYNPEMGDRDMFVIEQFKKFGRECIVSQANQVASVIEGDKKNIAVELAKSEISF